MTNVNFISAWKIKQSDAMPLVKQYSEIAKQTGATKVSVHHQHTGSNPGTLYIMTSFDNFEALGRAQEALHNNDVHRGLIREAESKGELVSRMITISEDL